MSHCVQQESSDLNGHLLTGRSATTDRTLSLQRPVVSSKVPETYFADRGRYLGKGSIDKLIIIDVIEITIDLCSNRLTLVFIYLCILCRVMYDQF